ncbi:hypothetical protein H6P81_004632 [Aristolochia fimbriata]|uniref:PGG domain-containing protein n=1 Tax=Aristolochia fimbriata TaxID=158543 RepID=A0AAV7EWQ7_ARIFI|nr:hypothetical protein H6P81_004632 [Aristolochia fimbriata]
MALGNFSTEAKRSSWGGGEMSRAMGSDGEQREMYEIAREMFRDAMRGKWNAVEEKYRTNPHAPLARITSSADTALHLAVTEGQTEVVRRLTKVVAPETLRLKNDRGDTPLHLAAAHGAVEMCLVFLNADAQLVEARNEDGETPLVLAALHGKSKAFFAIHSKLESGDSGLRHCRRDDGNTILHVAVLGEFFELAFDIIRLYPELVNYNNERGESALHVLAKNPFSFKSGHRFGRIEHILYFCIWVEPLKAKAHSSQYIINQYQEGEHERLVPENCDTCWTVCSLLWKAVNIIAAKCRACALKEDEEDPIENDQDNKDTDQSDEPSTTKKPSKRISFARDQMFPPNYITFFHFLEIVLEFLLVLFGVGIWKIAKLKEKKQKHVWAVQIVEELVIQGSRWGYNEDGSRPLWSLTDTINPNYLPELEDSVQEPVLSSQANKFEVLKPYGLKDKMETPILVAAKTGVIEIVEKILNVFPVSIQDVDEEGKNIILLAVENRQPDVYKLLMKKCMKDWVFQKVDQNGNSALHLAANLGDKRPWIISGAALQMQWEIKWFKFVKQSMPRHFFARLNNRGESAKELFTETHRGLLKEGGKWLTKTAESCSVVAALVATVAFATVTDVPGGIGDDGSPNLQDRFEFSIFAIASLLALCFSVTSLLMFLSILTSRHVVKDFEWNLPRKLVLGLTSLFFSIAAVLVSFCAGHYFVTKERLRYAALPIYVATCIPVVLFAFAQFPLYLDLIKAILTDVPQRTYRDTTV